ncbi:MAG TPA: late competence development ComFB family protein [Cellvibrionaceae bacterium]|nr:late competence development ComFB family protein [Cellvibrionaceae bacterium]HMW73819.1 late competence development ComFB family protein [Cellvibrionaceae bacterium]
MLINHRKPVVEADSPRDSVHNYYERFVFEQLLRASDRAAADANYFADVACVALNHLPPRYVRFDVDMSFFLSPQEMDEMADKVALAVNQALAYVDARTGTQNQNPPADVEAASA